MSKNSFPGTIEQQRVIRLIADYYATDSRIRAIGIFGSLARGNWDEFSDLDLDIVVEDDTQITIAKEFAGLCAFLEENGEEALLIGTEPLDAGDVVLASLVQFSIRYHPVATTNWKIVDTLQLIRGPLDLETIIAAGEVNRPASATPDLSPLLDRYLRYALGVSIDLQRERLWLAVELLHRMRQLMMQLYAESHGYMRPTQAFETYAASYLQQKLVAMLPQGELRSLHLCLQNGLTLLADDLDDIGNGKIELTTAHRRMIQEIHLVCASIDKKQLLANTRKGQSA